jgi:multicomponent Na+:H+ antiporter subunit C
VNSTTLFGLCAAGLVGIGLYGLIVAPTWLRRLIAFNVAGTGVFMVFGVAARRGSGTTIATDPVPQALVITGIVVAFAASALAVALVVRLAAAIREEETERDGTP